MLFDRFVRAPVSLASSPAALMRRTGKQSIRGNTLQNREQTAIAGNVGNGAVLFARPDLTFSKYCIAA